MNTIKLTLNGSNLDIEYHGSNLIPTASLNLDGGHNLRKLIEEMAEWCSRRPIGVASTKEEAPKHQQRHQEAQEQGAFNPWQSTLKERKEEFYKKPKWLPSQEEVDKAQEHWTE
jgi:hypothetical protein